MKYLLFLCAVSALFLSLAVPQHSEASTLQVYNINDSGAGSLRQAIGDNQTLGGGNTIVFSNTVSGTIRLTTGELVISNTTLTIVGPGAGVLAIDGNKTSRVFDISNSTVIISGLTITNGSVQANFGTDGRGGGILNQGTLTVSNCVITGNSVSGGDGAPAGNGQGGGIWNSGWLKLGACSITGNFTYGAMGGAYNSSTPANGGDADGGGIYNSSGLLLAVACTVNGNNASGGLGGEAQSGFNGFGGNAQGGGIFNGNAGVLLATNCTVTANTCAFGGSPINPDFNGSEYGGGICINAASMMLEHCTVCSNRLFDPGPPYTGLSAIQGGGICSFGSGTNHNTIIAGNFASYTESPLRPPDASGDFTSLGFNLVGKTDGSSGWIASDYTGTISAPLNPLLGPLTDNGGPTLTMVPQVIGSAVSLAIDNGTAGGTDSDQRGQPRPYSFASFQDPAGGDGSDIGAVELNPTLVTNTNDSGSGSLRQVILDSSSSNAGIIAFAPNVTGTILLTNGELLIGKSLSIMGPGADALAVSGNTTTRVFDITNGIVSISGLTIRDGQVVGAAGRPGGPALGGGVYCDTAATVTLTSCVISNCAALGGNGLNGVNATSGGSAGNGSGGGIFNLGSLALLRCWVVANRATGGAGGRSGLAGGFGGNGGAGIGGGIYCQSAPLTLSSSTVSGNRAIFGSAGNGGSGSGTNGTAAAAGLDDYGGGAMTLFNSTIASNVVSGAGTGVGGGIYSGGGGLLLVSSTVAGNNGDNSGGGIGGLGGGNVFSSIIADNTAANSPDLSSKFTSSGYNLIGNTSGSSGFGAAGDQLNVDPLLGPLKNNGGPTPTMALLPGSPAIDRGASGFFFDQRGAPRPFRLLSIPNSSGNDIGAFELGLPLLNIQIFGNTGVLSWPNYYGDFVMQLTGNMAASNGWSSLPGTPVIVGTQYILTNSPLSGSSFFRLKSN